MKFLAAFLVAVAVLSFVIYNDFTTGTASIPVPAGSEIQVSGPAAQYGWIWTE